VQLLVFKKKPPEPVVPVVPVAEVVEVNPVIVKEVAKDAEKP